MNRQGNLGKFGTHAEKSRAPHPAQGDSSRHTRDIAGANGRGQSRTDRLERRHRAVRGALLMKKLAQGNLEGIAEFAKLNEMGPEGQIQTDADDTDHSRDTPDKAVDGAVDAFDRFQHNILSPHVT